MPMDSSLKLLRPPTRRQPSRACAQRPLRPKLSFLSLPPELRVHVYSLLLSFPHAIDIAGIWHRKPALDISLFRVSKNISSEAAHYFYSTNTFALLEDCEAYRTDDNDITKHPGYAWLVKIATTNTHSLRNIHLYIRTERISSSSSCYHANDLFRLLYPLAKQVPNLVRLAVVPEAHQDCDPSFRALKPHRTKHHNRVVPLTPMAMRGMAHALHFFGRLKIVQIGGSQQAAEMDYLFRKLGGQVRVQGVEGSFAWRGTFGVTSGKLWEGVDAAMRWYDAAPGTVVKGMEKVEKKNDEGKDNKKEGKAEEKKDNKKGKEEESRTGDEKKKGGDKKKVDDKKRGDDKKKGDDKKDGGDKKGGGDKKEGKTKK